MVIVPDTSRLVEHLALLLSSLLEGRVLVACEKKCQRSQGVVEWKIKWTEQGSVGGAEGGGECSGEWSGERNRNWSVEWKVNWSRVVWKVGWRVEWRMKCGEEWSVAWKVWRGECVEGVMEIGAESAVEVESRMRRAEWTVVAKWLEEWSGKVTGNWRGKSRLEHRA